MKRKTNAFFIILSLILVLISCIGAHLIQTDFGHVTITDVRIPMPSGETLRVLVHRPDTATVDNPAPCVITSHGYHATLETQDITSIELARRGFVVFNMDTYSAGSSSGTSIPYNDSRSYYGLGMLQLVDYVHDNIDYIDPEEGNFTLIEAVAVVDKGENTNPNAMKIAECIIKNARTELLQNYPVALYQGESVDEELKPKNPQTFPEKLTTELLVKHQKLVKGE